MKRLPPIIAFFLAAVAWLVPLTVGWSYVSGWTSHPAAVLSHMALEFGAPDWVAEVAKEPGRIEAQTRILVAAPGGAPGARGDIVVDAKPSHYGYGLPIFLALLFAAGSKNLWGKAVVGYALMLPFQAFSLTLDLLKQMAVPALGGVKALGIQQWQLEAIAFGYQLGALVLPTLVPVVLWVWLDQSFFERVVAHALRPRPGVRT